MISTKKSMTARTLRGAAQIVVDRHPNFPGRRRFRTRQTSQSSVTFAEKEGE